MTIAKTFRPNKVKTAPTADDFNKLNENILETFSSISPIPLLSGNLLGPIVLELNTPTTVSHGLGKNYTSWFLCSPNNFIRVKENTSPDRSQWIILVSDTATVCMIYAI